MRRAASNTGTLSMSLRTQCAIRIARRHAPRTPCQRILGRYYSTTTVDDAAGFQQLRAEMLSRKSTCLREYIDPNVDHKLIDTLCTFLPREWCPRPHGTNMLLPMGHHLMWFNASMPVDKLLPDGTDPLQSPGAPWVRRMWAGGAVRVRPGTYYENETGFAADSSMVCAERIQDVQLRGQGETAKIFVTIDRRFVRLDTLRAKYKDSSKNIQKMGGQRVGPLWHFRQQLLSDEWGDAILREQRNLVFLKEKSPAELEAISAGQLATVKYLERKCFLSLSRTEQLICYRTRDT
jgi:hydroxyacyl-ACP dehydratase HTD2-like protein with hotdog domain